MTDSISTTQLEASSTESKVEMESKLRNTWGYGWTRIDKHGRKFISMVFKDSDGKVRHCNLFGNNLKSKEVHPDWVVNEKIHWRK